MTWSALGESRGGHSGMLRRYRQLNAIAAHLLRAIERLVRHMQKRFRIEQTCSSADGDSETHRNRDLIALDHDRLRFKCATNSLRNTDGARRVNCRKHN